MRKFSLLIFCTMILFRALAQSPFPNMPQAPQPATFHPVVISATLPHQPPPDNGVAMHEAEVRREARRQQEHAGILKDARRSVRKPTIRYELPSHRGDTGAGFYEQTYNELNAMLSGQIPLSLKKAVFLVENAYFGNRMHYKSYERSVQNLTKFCRLKMREEDIDPEDHVAVNELLFRFMSDTLTVTDPSTKKKATHYPVHYDFDDFYGKRDWTKMFVTKLMATNFGQCHSMPFLYAILAEELGAEAYLSASPSHLFIKYRDGNAFKNVELTNGHMTTDAYVLGSGYIKSEAIKSRIYLDTLSPKQAIALMMQDLGKGYYVRYGFDDFVLKCANTGLEYYPNDAYGMAIKSDYYTVLFQYVVSQMQGMAPNQVLSDPKAGRLFDQMQAMYKQMDDAGYTQMPEAAYEDWLQSIDEEKRKQDRALFLRYRQTQPLKIKYGKH